MPVRTQVPVGGKAVVVRGRKGIEVEADGEGEVVAPPSLSDYFEIYGEPNAPGGVRQITEYSEDGAGNLLAHSTFVAVLASEQSDVDTWADQIDTDTPDEIRGKVKGNANIPDLPSHAVKHRERS